MASTDHPVLRSASRVPYERLLERVRPVTLATQQVLPVLPALETLLPTDGLQRGITAEVAGVGATSLALSLLAGPSAGGSWAAVVGLPQLGLAAAAEIGVDLNRLAVVGEPEPGQWASVMAALVGAFDLVLVRSPRGARLNDARRLSARARERGTVIVHVAGGRAWPEGPDLRLTVAGSEWQGLGEGHGHLRGRRVHIEATGRRQASRPRQTSLWLLDPDGRVSPVESQRAVTILPGVHPEIEERHLVGDLAAELAG